MSHFTILLYKRCRPDYICWQERQEERQEGGVKICHYASCSTEVLLFLHPLFLSSFHLHFLYAWRWTMNCQESLKFSRWGNYCTWKIACQLGSRQEMSDQRKREKLLTRDCQRKVLVDMGCRFSLLLRLLIVICF